MVEKYIQKVKKIGDSLYLLIPFSVREKMGIVDGDVITLKIESVQHEEEVYVEYKCHLCKHRFSLEENEHKYCTACGNEDENSIVEVEDDNI